MALFAFGGCGAPQGTSTERVLRVGMTTEPNSLNPMFALNDYENFVDRFIFDVLVSVDPSGRRFVPRLASEVPTQSNGGISRDGLSITYHLRRGVRWQDGAPFTSRDVVFSFSALMNPANNVPNRRGYDEIRSVNAHDPYTVVVRLKRPYAPAVAELFSDEAPNGILPAHLLARERDLNRLDFNSHPIGTGPFRLLRWNRGQSVELERFDGYYGGTPKTKRVSIRFIPDEATMIDQLRTGELDVFAEGSVNAYGQLRSLPHLRIYLVDIHGASNVLINMTRPQFADVRVRRAIAYAIDKRAIVERFTFGSGTVATEDLPSFMWAYTPNVRRYDYDPSAARSLLREAGWRAGSDGLVTKNGSRLTAVMAFAQNNATARLVSVQIQSDLRAIGIDVELKGYNSAMMFAAYAAGGIYQGGHFDLAWYTMTLGVDPDSASRFSCYAIPPNGQNYSRYCNAEMDAAQADGLRYYDSARRKRAYARSQQLLARDVPIVFVFWPKDVEVASDRVYGMAPNPVVPSWNAEKWGLR
ncbi:MAG: peptide ABC transporter substrate-binding protein [Candidatus Eremiobacteraeota bacterium]|nr:peptide ABC transporter substrate-binding protein [Candidatus Eremiobacteraeota bacterium]